MIYKSEEELMYKAKQAEGKTFGEIDISGRIDNERAKGQLGQIVEESFFGYKINSKSEADFYDLGIELKVTPIRKNKNGTFSAKERLVLNIIDYDQEANCSFDESGFWRKNKKLLMMFYEWVPELNRADYKVLKSYLHIFPIEDLEVIKKDWELIVNKIKAGLAHELSEADTNYLAASTKGANRDSLRSQPFNDTKAMQRAFSLKQSYMTTLVQSIITDEDLTKFTAPQDFKEKSLEQLIKERFAPYIGKSLEEISFKTGNFINQKSKSFLPEFISELLGIKGTNINQIEEFAKANIKIKTVRLEPNDIPKEHMSFQNVNFLQWAGEEWDDSWLKNYFEETKFLLVIFQYNESLKENPNRSLHFNGVKLWNMPMHEIDGRLWDFWSYVQSLIRNGIELIPVQQKNGVIVKNNLPKPKFNGLCHIRPRATDGNDKTLLPDGRGITKQAFWLDKETIGEICKSVKE